MKKSKNIVIISISLMSLLFAFAGCTSEDSQIDNGVPVIDTIQEEVVEEAQEETNEIIEEVKEEPQEDIQEEKVEDIKEEIVEEIKEEPLAEITENETQDVTAVEEPPKEEKQEEIVEESKKEEIPKEEPKKEEPKEEYHWILNTNTKKVHKPSCSSVNEMKEKNKKESNASPQELKDQGYEACKRCKPF